MQQILMALGDYRFSIATAAYDSLKREHRYRWQAQPRWQQAPALQFTGYDKATLDLRGTIYPDLGAGFNQLELLRTQAGRGEPLLLVDGQGFVWGLWVIERVVEEQTYLQANGRPRKQTFRLQLADYGPDNQP